MAPMSLSGVAYTRPYNDNIGGSCGRFRAALGRPPNQAESTMLAELISGDNTAELVEDVLWAVTMLPEFQLVY